MKKNIIVLLFVCITLALTACVDYDLLNDSYPTASSAKDAVSISFIANGLSDIGSRVYGKDKSEKEIEIQTLHLFSLMKMVSLFEVWRGATLRGMNC